MSIKQVEFHYANYSIMREAQSVALFKLAIYHKFISGDPHYQKWAEEAFEGYLKVLSSNPPQIDTVLKLQKLIDDYRII